MVLGSVSKTSSMMSLGLLSATLNKCSSAVSDSWGVVTVNVVITP